MKRRFFSTLLFFVLLLFALNLQGDVSYKREPMITTHPETFTKYIDILSNKVAWAGGDNVAHVAISAELEGLGYGFATLKDVYLMGEPSIAVYGNPKKYYFGTKDHNGRGSWKSGTTTVEAIKKEKIPDKAKDGASWDWGASRLSEISPTQYEWHESTSLGFNISIPKGITGRYTTTGDWAEGSLPVMTAAAKSGKHKLVVKYICHQCYATGKTAAEIGGKSKHEKSTCPQPNCSVKYHKCSTPWNHKVCSACGDRKCDGDDHSVCSGCGNHKCTVSDTSSCDAGTCNGIVTDNTPNCPDCTSHCSPPCLCSNSGTCNGTVTDNTPDCSYCTDGCSACPPQIVACGGASYTGCSGASSRTEHHVPLCSNGCGNGYWTCDAQAVYNHETTFTCRRCGTSFTRCSNGTCTTATGTYDYHWAQ